MTDNERFVSIGDTRLFLVDRGQGYPIIVLHGGPGFDHHEFADYLDPLCDSYRLLLVDQRSQGRSDSAPRETWTIQHMAEDVTKLAKALALDKYAVLGHSFGAFVALHHAVNFPGSASQTIISGGIPSLRFLETVEENLASFEPVDLRERIKTSWERETTVTSPEELEQLWIDQAPFHFKDPLDPRIQDYLDRSSQTVYSPEVLKHFAAEGYGGIDLEDQLAGIEHPVLVLGGRYDRVCIVEASEAMAARIPGARLKIFEDSAHMFFVEEPETYLESVRSFLDETRSR